MARKKAVPVEEQEPNLETQGLPEGEAVTGEGEFQESLPEAPGGEGGFTDGLPENLGEPGDPPEGLPGPVEEEAESLPADALPPNDVDTGEEAPGNPPDIPPESGEAAAEVPEGPRDGEILPESAAPQKAAIGSRRLAARSQRYFFAHRPALSREGTRLKCRLLSVGPRRCLVECYGHDIGMTQRDLRYTAIPDLRNEYRPGQELDCVVKSYDPEKEALRISVKETESNPFEGAEFRHPAGSRRQAVIAGKYGGGVFCNLPDGTVCMCNYSYQHEDSDFLVGDTVILVVQRHDLEKRQMYGKILSKW